MAAPAYTKGTSLCLPVPQALCQIGKIVNRKVLAIILILLSTQSYAVEPSEVIDQAFKSCSELGSYKKLSGCMNNVLSRADKSLNQNYSLLMDYLDSSVKKDPLKSAQRNWIKFRDSDCKLWVLAVDNKKHKVSRDICLYKKTINRVRELEHYNQEKGCNGCGF